MKTADAVVDGKLQNELLGQFYRRVNEILRRMNDGTLEPQWVLNKLQRVVEGRTTGEPHQWNIWKTVCLGTGLRTPGDFRQALGTEGMRIGDWANDILGKPAFKASETKMEVDLVVVSVADLGFKKGAILKDIYAKAQELDLTFCPAEVGPQLRLQYKDQPVGEQLYIAMESISASDGYLGVFRVERNDRGRWLSSGSGYPSDFWHDFIRFVFVLRK